MKHCFQDIVRLSITVKDRAARECSSSALMSVVESSRGGESRDQWERRHREAQTAPPVPEDPGYVCGTSGRTRVRYPHLLELSPEQEDSGRWHLYHTPTGRLTGYLRERQKYSLAAQEESNKRSPWLPPSTSPDPGVTAGNNKVRVRHKDNRSAKASAHKYRDSIMVAAPESDSTDQPAHAAVRQFVGDRHKYRDSIMVAAPQSDSTDQPAHAAVRQFVGDRHKYRDSIMVAAPESDSTDQPAHAAVRQFVGDREPVQEMDATYTVSQSIQLTQQRTTHSMATTGDAVSKPRWHHEESPLAPETRERSERYSRGKEMVVEGAEMRHEALAIARRYTQQEYIWHTSTYIFISCTVSFTTRGKIALI